jgi:hypothetical protein
MNAADESGRDDDLQIMVIDRRGRVSGFVELEDLLALCAAALGDLADRASPPPPPPPARPVRVTPAWPESGS